MYVQLPIHHDDHTDCLALVDDREAVFTDVTGDNALLFFGGGDCGDGVTLLDPLDTASLR